MYDFTGCECAICHHHFKLNEDDIVVCPDCGAPYHRDCYASLGHCKHQSAHAQNYEWQPPEMEKKSSEIICTSCGAKNALNNSYCKDCGLPLSAQTEQTPPATGSSAKYQTPPSTKPYDYQGNPTPETPHVVSPFSTVNGFAYVPRVDANDKIDDIPIAEWASYIGAASPIYISMFQHMKQTGRKFGLSISALLFGPFYFFYRKAWGPALLFSLLSIVVNIPSLLTALVYSESIFAPNISADILLLLSRISIGVGWGLMMIQSLYAVHLYKKSAKKKILKIQSEHKDPKQRMTALKLHGGTSFGAVFLAIIAMGVLSYIFALFLGPNLNAVMSML